MYTQSPCLQLPNRIIAYNQDSDTASRRPVHFTSFRVSTSNTKKTSLFTYIYIYIYIYIYTSRVERTSSTSPQQITETEFRIHKTKPIAFNLRPYPTPTQSLLRSSRGHHKESSYQSADPLLASPERKFVGSTSHPLSFPMATNCRSTALGQKGREGTFWNRCFRIATALSRALEARLNMFQHYTNCS